MRVDCTEIPYAVGNPSGYQNALQVFLDGLRHASPRVVVRNLFEVPVSTTAGNVTAIKVTAISDNQ